MTETFESESKKKALIYTSIICSILLLLFIFIRWTVNPPAQTVIQDLIELNLGSFNEGYGEEEPLVKGTPTVSKEEDNNQNKQPDPPANDNVSPDDNADDAAAPVTKTETKPKPQPEKNKTTIPVTLAPTAKPKLLYQGTNTGKNGNNPDVDNYKYQGKNPNGVGDAGDPNGNKDSYGSNPGGNTGGPRVTKGNRKIVKHYKFDGELSKATIYAIIKVSPSGQGTFIGFDKGTTNRNSAYANAVKNYLNNIQFDKSEDESTVTVQFIFDVN
jgi:hypothetical protein